ncbi:pentapeptide repeat-containing protein [Cryobacterium sp. TMT4-10]|uniref:pentapeptide repeat-containing protein n=1 Tax=Cryobacterium sp. TMT4-10 TaxID=1259256 RepID=UPI00106A7726|nr:pentapeptide repeat-containing protein [Cryobacterium sp. TMT4-10]TFD11712.1 pentapeptide repeat-containing protein [Cryobacterium sp. TMT4-10]
MKASDSQQSVTAKGVRGVLASPPWLVRDVVVALVVGIAAGVISGLLTTEAQRDIDDQRSDRERAAAETLAGQSYRLENLRFVRDRSSDDARGRPYNGLDLQGMELSGLSLTGADFRNANLNAAAFRDSDLRGADFAYSDIGGTDFFGAKLTGAAFVRTEFARKHGPALTFFAATLVHAKLMEMKIVDVDHADLTEAMLYGSDLTEASFIDTNLTGVCYDVGTTWPKDFNPPPTGDPKACGRGHVTDFFAARGTAIPDEYLGPGSDFDTE